MSGLDEAVAAIRSSVGSPGRFPDEDCLRVIRYVGEPLLRAVVAEMTHDECWDANREFYGNDPVKRVESFKRALLGRLLAALARLTP